MASDAALLQHLEASHPGVHTPWFAGSRFIDCLTDGQLERLHSELYRQGEDCSVVLDGR